MYQKQIIKYNDDLLTIWIKIIQKVTDMEKVKVAILGATGMVGQRFIQCLIDHPYFELTDLTASSRSAGKRYEDAAKWYLDGDIPREVRGIVVKDTIPSVVDADIVFSALPSANARESEPAFAEAGFIVASNASTFRMTPDIPLLIPEINPEHLDMIELQKDNRGWDGAIITNPNCSTIMNTLSLKPVYDNFGIKKMFVATMQAVSGAGYNGVPSMAIVDNVIPFIGNEEDKLEEEPNKILGSFNGSELEFADIKISASCNRVPVLDGHTESIFVETGEKTDVESIKKAMKEFQGLPQKLKLPYAPENPLIVRDEQDRPQPRLDRNMQKGMAVTVGRIREDPILDFKWMAMGHNTIRGAAGASVLNAELLVKTKKI